MSFINKYVGTYRVFQNIDLTTGKASENEYDTYLKGKYNTQVYRYDKNTLALYFAATNTVNKILPVLKDLGVQLKLFVQGDFESVYLFPEQDLSKVHSILKFQTKGKNIQAKSIKTARRQKQK